MVTILLMTGGKTPGRNLPDLFNGSTGRIIRVSSVPEALELRDREGVDAVVAFYETNEVESLSLLRSLRGRGDTIPFILLLETFNDQVICEVLSLDATYFVQLQSTGDCIAALAKIIGNTVECRRLKSVVADQEKKINALFYQSQYFTNF